MKIPTSLNIDPNSINQYVDEEGNTYGIRVLSKGENLFFQENGHYLLCLIDAAHGVIEVDSITKWEPNKRMSPKERTRVIALIEKYYREVYRTDVRLYSRKAEKRKKDLSQLIDTIRSVETKLSEWVEVVDNIELSDLHLLELADKERRAFYDQHGSTIQTITGQIMRFFVKSETHERQAIWEALSSTNHLQFHLHVKPQKEENEDWLNKRLMLLIISDLGVDTRDVLMELNALRTKANELNIHFQSIIQRHIHLANTEDKHGMGSMRTILGRMLDSN